MDQGERNFQTAKSICKLLRIEKNDPALLKGIKAACNDCDRVGPPEGKACASLRLARELGCDYEPPEWCRDPGTIKERNRRNDI